MVRCCGTLVGDGPALESGWEPGHHHGLSCSRGGEVGSQAAFPNTWLEAVVGNYAAALEVESKRAAHPGKLPLMHWFLYSSEENDLDRY